MRPSIDAEQVEVAREQSEQPVLGSADEEAHGPLLGGNLLVPECGGVGEASLSDERAQVQGAGTVHPVQRLRRVEVPPPVHFLF